MSNAAVEAFAKQLIDCIRDTAIQSADRRLSPPALSPTAQRWRTDATRAGGVMPAATLIPECTDDALANLLWAVDEGMLCLSFTTERGETMYLPEDGQSEMCGWYGGPNSWRTWYSTERILDLDDFDFSGPRAELGGENIPDAPPPIVENLPMPRRAVEEFARLLVRHVRDVAIQRCDAQLVPQCQTIMAQRWRRAAIPFQGRVPPEVVIPDCVDMTIVTFLNAIDQGLLPLSYTSENGEIVNLVTEGQGELAAKYLAPNGWRALFSKERFADDAAVLNTPPDP